MSRVPIEAITNKILRDAGVTEGTLGSFLFAEAVSFLDTVGVDAVCYPEASESKLIRDVLTDEDYFFGGFKHQAEDLARKAIKMARGEE